MSTTSTVAARLDPEVRRRAHSVLARSNLSDSQFIRRMYSYVAQAQEIPECILSVEYDGVHARTRPSKFESLATWIEEGPYATIDFTFLTDDSVTRTLSERDASW